MTIPELAVRIVSALPAAERSGPPDILSGIFGIALLMLSPLVGAVVLGLLQLGVYRLLVRLGWVKPEAVPFFFVLMLRGMMLALALIAAVVFWLRFVEGRPGFQPPG